MFQKAFVFQQCREFGFICDPNVGQKSYDIPRFMCAKPTWAAVTSLNNFLGPVGDCGSGTVIS
jgi:hypothetical protein